MRRFLAEAGIRPYVVTFQVESVHDLRKAFQDSIEDYLEFCAERGEEPERPFSGKFTVRISPELHRKLFVQAKMLDKSLNGWVNELFEESVEQTSTPIPSL